MYIHIYVGRPRVVFYILVYVATLTLFLLQMIALRLPITTVINARIFE
jgi:hypothetical protein